MTNLDELHLAIEKAESEYRGEILRTCLDENNPLTRETLERLQNEFRYKLFKIEQSPTPLSHDEATD